MGFPQGTFAKCKCSEDAHCDDEDGIDYQEDEDIDEEEDEDIDYQEDEESSLRILIIRRTRIRMMI